MRLGGHTLKGRIRVLCRMILVRCNDKRGLYCSGSDGYKIMGDYVIWVDVAQVVGALATAGALIFVTQQTKHSQAAVIEAQRMHKLESAREKRALKFDAQRQAAEVVAWPVKATFQGNSQWGLRVVNNSSAPVFDIRITRQEVTAPGKTTIPALDAKAKVLAPGQYFISDRLRWPVLVTDKDDAEPILGSAGYMGLLEFKDGNGRDWRREPSGALVALSGEHAG